MARRSEMAYNRFASKLLPLLTCSGILIPETWMDRAASFFSRAVTLASKAMKSLSLKESKSILKLPRVVLSCSIFFVQSLRSIDI